MNIATLALLVSAVVSGNDGCITGNPYVVWTATQPPVEQQVSMRYLALGPNGRVFGTWSNPPFERNVFELRPDGAPVPIATLGLQPDRMTVARDGTIYVFANPVITGRSLFAVRGGVVVNQFTMQLADTAPDLAADQCTLFYAGLGDRIRRLNVCTGAQLPDFATGLPPVLNVRVLPDGGVLAGHQGNIFVNYAPDGTVRRQYTAPGDVPLEMPIAISGTQRSFWTTVYSCATGTQLVEFDLDSGAVLTQQPVPRIVTPYALVLTDGWTAALGAFAGAPIGVPSLSIIGIGLLVALLAVVAVRSV